MRTRTTLAASGSALLFACGGGVTHAQSAVPAALPEPGTAFSVGEDGDMVMECDGVVHRVEVHGAGEMHVGDRLPGDQPTFAVSTDAEQLTGYEADLGWVTVTQKEPVAGEFVAASAGQPFPAAESLAQDVTVTMEHSPCRGGRSAAYESQAGFPLLNTDLRSFPPHNAVYQRLDPTELVDVSDRSAPSFMLTGFVLTLDQM